MKIRYHFLYKKDQNKGGWQKLTQNIKFERQKSWRQNLLFGMLNIKWATWRMTWRSLYRGCLSSSWALSVRRLPAWGQKGKTRKTRGFLGHWPTQTGRGLPEAGRPPIKIYFIDVEMGSFRLWVNSSKNKSLLLGPGDVILKHPDNHIEQELRPVPNRHRHRFFPPK